MQGKIIARKTTAPYLEWSAGTGGLNIFTEGRELLSEIDLSLPAYLQELRFRSLSQINGILTYIQQVQININN